MSDCPGIDELVRGDGDTSARAARHASECAACRAVLALVATRAQDSRSASLGCARFEALIAGRAAGGLPANLEAELADHLLGCTECRTLAQGTPVELHEGLPVVPVEAYELGPEIARGGMGRIRAARDLRVGRAVAVKELLDRTPAGAARFAREARITARLQHPGIVPIYEVGRWTTGLPFYAMRIVPGKTLRDAIGEARTLRQRIALVPSVLAVAQAVAYAHDQKVIHRDLTPNNVLLGTFGETVVIDWGLAKELVDDAGFEGDGIDAASSGELTSSGAVIGTAAYMPPEQAEGKPVDGRADVYALGAILYHLLTGAAPYLGGDSDAVLARVRAGPPPAVDSIEPATPGYLIAIVQKAMARDAGDRYASVRALADDLGQFHTGQFVPARDYSTRTLPWRWWRRNRTLLTASVAAFVALVLAGSVSALVVLRKLHRTNADLHGARQAEVELLENLGRAELTAGAADRALAFAAESHRLGRRAPSLARLLDDAARAAGLGGALGSPDAVVDWERTHGRWRVEHGHLVARTTSP